MSTDHNRASHLCIDQYDPSKCTTEEEIEFHGQFINNIHVGKVIVLLERVLSIEEACLKRDKLMDLVNMVVHEGSCLEEIMLATIEPNCLQAEKLYNLLISLPELVTNLYGQDHAKFIDEHQHYARLCSTIERTLTMHVCNADVFRFNLFYFHYLVGRLCLKGHSDIVWRHFLHPFILKSQFASSFSANEFGPVIILRHILLNYIQDSPNVVIISYNIGLFLEPILRLLFFRISNALFLRLLISEDYWNMERDRLAIIIEKRILFGDSWFPNFERHYPDQVLLNLLLFFYESNFKDKNGVHMFKSIVRYILFQWRNHRFNKYRTYCQHFYLCRQILLATKICLDKTPNQCYDGNMLMEIQNAAANSMAKHLETIEDTFKVIGITTNYLVLKLGVKTLNTETNCMSLEKFFQQFEQNDDTDYLRQLVSIDLNKVSSNPILEPQSEKTKECPRGVEPSTEKNEEEPMNVEENEPETKTNRILGKKSTTELDSDDDEDADLVPISMTDVPVDEDVRFRGRDSLIKVENVQELIVDNKNRAPIYLKDLIEGLGDEKNPQWQQKCIERAETIIRKHLPEYDQQGQPKDKYSMLDTVAHQLTERLMFAQLSRLQVKARDRALVALCVGAPKIVSKYLTSKFYSQELSVQQRVLALSTLYEAASELSELGVAQIEGVESKKEMNNVDAKNSQSAALLAAFRKEYFHLDGVDSDDEEEPRTTSSSSLARSQRVISAPRQQPKAKANLFVPVASGFFFPLLRRPSRSEMPYDMFGQDPILLERLIYTLGGLMYFCQHHTLVKQMAKELVEFLPQYHDHHER